MKKTRIKQVLRIRFRRFFREPVNIVLTFICFCIIAISSILVYADVYHDNKAAASRFEIESEILGFETELVKDCGLLIISTCVNHYILLDKDGETLKYSISEEDQNLLKNVEKAYFYIELDRIIKISYKE